VDDLEYVINYEIPNVSETYVHRIWRTWRAWAKWTALSFCDAEEKAYIKDIEKLINKKIPVIENHPFPLVDHNPVKVVKQQWRRNSSRSGPSRPRNNNNTRKRFSNPNNSR
jgi:ATP-dependent RNA helicase RhlE